MPLTAIYKTTDRLIVPGFDFTLPCVVRGKQVYFPIRAVCKAMQLQPQRQIDRLRHCGKFDGEGDIEAIGVLTKTGNRPTECIRKDRLAAWFDMLNPIRIRSPKIRGKLVELQRAMSDAGDRFLWGDASIIGPADGGPGALPAVLEGTTTISGECPYCGGHLCVTIGPQGTHFMPLPAEPLPANSDDDSE